MLWTAQVLPTHQTLVDITQCSVHRITQSAVLRKHKFQLVSHSPDRQRSRSIRAPMQRLLIDALIHWLSTVPMSSGVHPRQTPGIAHRCVTSRDRIEQRTYAAWRPTERRLILMQHTTEQGSYYLREFFPNFHSTIILAWHLPVHHRHQLFVQGNLHSGNVHFSEIGINLAFQLTKKKSWQCC